MTDTVNSVSSSSQPKFDPTNPADQKEFLVRLEQHTKDIAALKSDAKQLQIDAKILFKVLSKKGGKKMPKDPNAPKKDPSGFAKPQKVSEELTKFLSIPADEEIARTEVTKRIVKYIQEKNLQNPENKREILLDAPLKKLLAVDGPITFFQLQIYMKHHFPSTASSKSKKKEDAAPAPTPEPAEAPAPVADAPVTETKTKAKKVVVKRKTAGATAKA